VRTIAVALGSLVIATAAIASSVLDVTALPKPGFPLPATDPDPSTPRLELEATRYRSPGELPPPGPAPPSWASKSFRGQDLQLTVRQGANVFLVYGRDGSSGRYVVGASARTRRLRYAFDFVNFAHAPNGGWFEEVTWAREIDGVLYVENTHLTYATATRGRNAYISAIDLSTKKTLWRSPALVANARTFVVSRDLIVSGYGFTAERDFLYVLDRRTGRILDRLAVPSAPEIIKLRGDRLDVRTYDRQVVARIAGS
jgi:outer membrane protein assembly factor BamB